MNNCDKRFSDFHECDEGAREHIGSAKEKRYLAVRESACGHFSRLSGLLTIVPILEKKIILDRFFIQTASLKFHIKQRGIERDFHSICIQKKKTSQKKVCLSVISIINYF